MWCVLHKDVSQGDEYVNGPYEDRAGGIGCPTGLPSETVLE